MSKYVEAEAKYTNVAFLVEALLNMKNPYRNVNWEEKQVEVHLENTPKNQKVASRLRKKYPEMVVKTNGAKQLEGYYASDVKGKKANIVIPKKYLGSVSNDVGFLVGKKGTTQYISDVDKNISAKPWQDRLLDEYGLAEFKKKCRREGWKYVEKRLEDGQPRLIIDNPT